MLTVNDNGLYCAAGNFYIDPWRPVDRALITHAHGDHARWGSRHYLGTFEGQRVLRTRLGSSARIQSLRYGESITIGGVRVSFHPAGHILGSAQIRLEYGGEIWVVSGDYKTEPDSTCSPFEPIRCHTFITESTFGLPIYRWPTQESVFEEINAWWRANRDEGKASILYGYALGKAQRLLAGLDPDIGPIYTHGAVQRLVTDYRDSGIELPKTMYAGSAAGKEGWGGSMIVAPPSAHGTPWMRKFGAASTAFASGWMRIRGARRRRAVDRGFVLSDHVDWPNLLTTVEATGAERILVTHGYVGVVVGYLREQGMDADGLETRYEGDENVEVEAESEE